MSGFANRIEQANKSSGDLFCQALQQDWEKPFSKMKRKPHEWRTTKVCTES